MFATTSITVLRPVNTGMRDEFNEEIVDTYIEEYVDDVLVSPAGTEDNLKENPEGVTVDYVFHFPYWYEQSLRDCRINFEGEQYAIVGDPRGYMPENTPTSWNRPVKAYLVDEWVTVGNTHE